MRLALLTNFVPPYRVPVFQALQERTTAFRVLVSTMMEGNRPWTVRWGTLDVVLQRTWTLHRTWRHTTFAEGYELHVPLDTLPQLRRFRPDAIITAEFGARTAQAMAYAAVAGVPLLVWAPTVDHLEVVRGSSRTVARRLMVRRMDGVLVNGEGGARYFHRLGVPDRLIHRVPQAVELAPFTAIPLQRPPGSGHRVLYVGSLTPRKGVGLLLQGAAAWAMRYPDRHLHVTIVGHGPEDGALRALDMPGNVHVAWEGAVDYHDLPRHYATADVVAFPSLGDEWGLVVNEAMAAGVPVLGSVRSQAVDELVEDGRNGWRFDPVDGGAMAAALERVLATPPEALGRMRAAARATASRITPEWVADRIMAALHEVSH